MRTFFAAVGLFLAVLLVAGFFSLYYWVPRLKMAIVARGTTVTSGEMLLINASNIVVNYWYMVLPMILAVSYGAWQMAFADESVPPNVES